MSQTTNRIHSLDALRAIMMMLGIVLHSTEPYSGGQDAFWPKDPEASSEVLALIFGIIHVFRMPIFFLIAGFFGALLFYERGADIMLKNRFKRVVLPFLVFVLVLHPMVIMAFSFAESAFETQVSSIVTTMTLFPKITYHLWFLYYLVIISLIFYLIAVGLRNAPKITGRIQASFEWLMKRRVVFVTIFSIVVFVLLVWMWDTWISTSVSFAPNPPVLVAYSLFYLIGWLLFKSKHLLEGMMKSDRQLVVAGVMVFIGKEIYHGTIGDIAYGALNALVVWFFIFGIMGLFMRYFNKHSKTWRYVSDASYWVYLVHLPLVAWFSGVIVDLPFSAIGKFLIVSLLTTVVCFATYHFLVRPTFIGKFLNGRRYQIR